MLPNGLVFRTKSVQQRIEQTAMQTAGRLLPDLSKLSQAGAGGSIRKVAVATVDTFGKVATEAAQQSYTDLRAVAVAGSFKPAAQRFNAEVIVEPIIGAAMSAYQQDNYASARVLLVDAIGKSVSDVFRQQMVGTSYDDSQATGYQRIPSPTCCAFCAVVALNEYTTFDDGGGYHNGCGCTTIPVFKGLGSFRPSYYDQLETDYTNATKKVGASDAESVFAEIRKQTGRR